MKKFINGILVVILIALFSYTIFTYFDIKVPYLSNYKITTDIKVNHENIYIVVGSEYKITTNYDKVLWFSGDEKIAQVNEGIVKGISKGTTTITIKKGRKQKSINVIVTDLITSPTLNNKKSYLKCHQYTDEEAKLLDLILAFKINDAGYQTRAGAVAAARFLTLEFKWRLHYFYENGRLLTNGERDYVDAEGRYYHVGLYLSEDKFASLKESEYGPAIWGCPLYSGVVKRTSANGLDCSGYVSWLLLNAGFDVGDAGAGISAKKTNDLDDLGDKITISDALDKSDQVKVGDLLSRGGHIGILIGIDDGKYYIAEALDYDLHVLTMTKKDLLNSDWKYFILMDKVYKEDGNLKNFW